MKTLIEQLRQNSRIDGKHHPAKLLLGDKVLCMGSVLLEPDVSTLVFLPDGGKTLTTPIHGAALILRETGDTLSGVSIQDCPTREHYHLA